MREFLKERAVLIDKFEQEMREEKVELKDNIRLMPYIDNMTECLAASDLVVSRSGALTVAETCTCGRASVLVPSPNVTGNHQYYNAKEVADRGGAVLIEEKDFDFDTMMPLIVKLLNDPEEVEKMAECAKALAGSDAAEAIYEGIMKDFGGEDNE